ncbi:restriction endonuclease subunit S [Mycoplasma sp. Z331B]|uniref:restriction endonuclease subunit S n=1 Tax=unclassified Mycoplasma TaxID=2683645 RepID=UPI003A8828CF
MQKEKLVPAIRFKGFEEEWNNLYLFQLIKYAKSGGTPNTANVDFWNGNIPFLTIADLKNKTYISQTAKSITQLGLHSSSAWIVPSGALVLSIYATIGKSAILSSPMATSQAFISILTNNDSASFLHRIFERMDLNGAWSSLQSTGTQSNLNANIIKNLVIKYPKSKSEINIISNLFENIDDLISMHELKLEKLQTIKQSLLIKMFALYEQKMPEIRFKGFNEEWKTAILADYFTQYKNTIYLNDNEYYNQISISNKGIVSHRDTKKGAEIGRKRQYLIDTINNSNTLVFTRQTIYEGGIGFVPSSLNGYIVTENMPLFNLRNMSINFARTFLRTQSYFKSVIDSNPLIGSAQKALHEDLWLKSTIYVTNDLDEQQKIGQFFSNLDSLIHSCNQKLEKLNNIKQALLEKMFC